MTGDEELIMGLNHDRLTPNQEKQVRAIVREEIVKAFQVLGREADGLDTPYETAELDSRALENIKAAAEGTVRRLTCPHEEYYTWGLYTVVSRCGRCGEPEPEPVNPFEAEEPTRRARTCPVGPDVCGDIIGWEPFLAHIYHTHTSVEQTEEERQNTVQTILRRGKTHGTS
jgi:hypothetical protein